MLTIRKITAILLICIFTPIFIISLIISQSTSFFQSSKTLNQFISETLIIENFYQVILPEISNEIVKKEIEITKIDNEPIYLKFIPGESSAMVINDIFINLLPEEYVSEISENLITQLSLYINGDIDEFEIDFKFGQRISSIGNSFEKAVYELNLVQSLSQDVIIPISYNKFSPTISNSIGINFTNEEFNNYFQEVMPNDWLEQNLIDGVNEITFYFSGESDDFNINIPVSDRVNLIGEVFKDKLQKDESARTVVFTKVIEPMSKTMIKSTNNFNYGISLSREEIIKTIKGKASDKWMKEESGKFIDAFIEHLNSEEEKFLYDVDITTLRDAAIENFIIITSDRLDQRVENLPECSGLAALFTINLKSPDLPKCLPEDENLRKNISSGLHEVIKSQVTSFVTKSLPTSFKFSLSQISGGKNSDIDKSVKEIKGIMEKGIVFSEQDFYEILLDSNNQNFKENIDLVRNDIPVKFNSDNLEMLEPVKTIAKRISPLSYLQWIFIPIILIISFIGGNGLVQKIKWTLSIIGVWLLFYVFIFTLVWGFISPDKIIFQIIELNEVPFISEPNTLKIINSELSLSISNGVTFIRNQFLSAVLPWGIMFLVLLGIYFVLQKNNKFSKYLNSNKESN